MNMMCRGIGVIIFIAIVLVGCGTPQPYQRCYILAEEITKKSDTEMASKCSPIEVKVDLKGVQKEAGESDFPTSP